MKDYIIKTSKNKESKALDIKIEGHLNVSNISEIQKEFNNTIKNSKKLSVEVSNVDDADITFVQMITAFKQKCKVLKIELDIDFKLNKDTIELFNRAGLTSTIN